MAPGAAGGGGTGGGRSTGTVPKTKLYDQGRDQRREHGPPLNHVSNNLLGLDWQTAQTYDRRTRKNSNRSISDQYELPVSGSMDDGGSSHDNRCIMTYTPPDSSQWSSPGRTPPGMDVTSPNRDRAQCNVMCDKSNIFKTEDRNEVVNRLNQICDYIKQTSYLMDTLKNSENSNLVEMGNGGSSARRSVGTSPASNISLSRASSQGRRQSAAEREELRLKVEESQRKLQALQEHQAALAALQDTARQQLQEARQEQNALMVHCSVGERDRERECAEGLDDAVKLDQLQQRLQSLAEMCHNRNKLGGEEGVQDDLLPEQLVLQDKLQQLQSKKLHINHLAAVRHNNPSPSPSPSPTGPKVTSQDGGVVRDKIAELNIMKQQLAHLKDLVASVERNKEAEEVDTQEQAVNLRRQNVRGSSAEEDLTSDIHVRTQRLRDAQSRLQQLQELMGLVGEAHASGSTLPDHYVDTLLCDTSSSPHRTNQVPVQMDKNAKDLYPAVREKKTNSQSQRQLIALELQAKRLQLEALMSKDEGLPSAINHDKPHPLLSEYRALGDENTGGTWGTSTIEDLADPDQRDHSLCYSSDEVAEEQEDDELESWQRVQHGDGTLGQSPRTIRDPTVMSMSVDSALNAQPCLQLSGGVAPLSSWVVSHDTTCTKTTQPVSEYAPNNPSHASVTSNVTSANNVFKPPHLQVNGPSSCGMMYSPLPGDAYYQQLLATSQIQQQNMVLTMLNQCCQLLWLQQRELQSLRSAVHSLQERGSARPGIQSTMGNASCDGLFLPTQDDVQLNNCFPATTALNNQVPPGNRANNYWDNFRSYSRQNQLSSSAGKSNEELACTSHSASPLVERSHNSLQGPAVSLDAASLPVPLEQGVQMLPGGRKEKLNADQSQSQGSQRLGAINLGPTIAVKKKRHPNPKITASAPRNTQNKCASHEPVSEEVAALISANENRPQFLLHLFRELRAFHSDYLRQNAAHSIQHHLVHGSTSQEEAVDRLGASLPALQEEDKMNGMKGCTSAADWSFPNQLSEKDTGSSAPTPDHPQDGEGEAAVVPEPLPRNAAWKMKDLLSVSPDLQLVAQGQGHGRPDWSGHSVVAELRPLLLAHQDDLCTPVLLETLHRAAVRLLPPAQGDVYNCNQLDTLLHDALQRFLHCRLGSVAEQLLDVVADLLQGEMNYLAQAGQLCRPPSPGVLSAGAVSAFESVEWHVGGDLTATDEVSSLLPLLNAVQDEPVVAVPEMYNGDLAEADQSCRAERDSANNSCSGEVVPQQETNATCSEVQHQDTQVCVLQEEEAATAVQADDDAWDGQDWTPPSLTIPGMQSP